MLPEQIKLALDEAQKLILNKLGQKVPADNVPLPALQAAQHLDLRRAVS